MKIPLGFIGEVSAKHHKMTLIDSTKALRSGAALSTAIEQTFDAFVETCKQEIKEEKMTGQKRPGFWQYNKTTADTIKLINAKSIDMLKPMHNQNKNKRPKTASTVNNRPLLTNS